MIGRRTLLLAALVPKPALAWQPRRPRLPDVALTDQFGRPWRFASGAVGNRVVALDLIFADCGGICPISTRVMADARRMLSPEEARQIRCLTLTLDPDRDTPARLRDYAEAAGAHGDWLFLTGSQGNIGAVLAALRARLGGAPESHEPVFWVGDGASNVFHAEFGMPAPEELRNAMALALARRADRSGMGG